MPAMVARPRSHQLEDESKRAFGSALPGAWVSREVKPDYGIDYTVEIFTASGERTARSFHVQLKATDEANLQRALRDRVRFDRKLVEYYRALAIPLLVVMYHGPTARLFARWFHAYDPHVKARSTSPVPESMAFRFSESDAWSDAAEAELDAAVRGFLAFRGPALALPIPLAVYGSDGAADTVMHVTFALRAALDPVADLVRVEQRSPTADEASVRLSGTRTRVSLAGVTSVTLDHDDAPADLAQLARDVAVAIAVALAKVGQANLAAQIGLVTAARSRIITDFEVSFSLAAAMYEARRLREAIQLADELDASDDADVQVAATAFEMALLGARRLTAVDRALALEAAERRIDRRLERGEPVYAAAAAYTLAMQHKRAAAPEQAIAAFERAGELDPRYQERAYYHRDLGGVLFGSGKFGAAATHYRRALDLGDTGMVEALYADALLFAGRYARGRRAVRPVPVG
jgi:tetratricopeptide (TPR) repeat protein